MSASLTAVPCSSGCVPLGVMLLLVQFKDDAAPSSG